MISLGTGQEWWKLAKWNGTRAQCRWGGSRVTQQTGYMDAGRLSISNYSNPLSSLSSQKERIREKFVAALQREFAGKGLRFSRGEREGCFGFAFVMFPIKFCEGEQESQLFTLSVWKPWDEQKELLVLESCHGGVAFASMTSASMQRISRAADFPSWESARQTGFHPLTLFLP